MDKRKLGQLEVSPIGMGCMGFSHGYGQVPPEAYAIEAIRGAYDYGCTHFDTAEAYGKEQFYAGHNEELVGKAIEPFRKKVVLATKFHIGELSKPDETNLYREVRRHLEDSMSRLRTDYIDLYYLHRISEAVRLEDVATVMGRLIQEGLIRGWGLSQVSADQIRAAHKITPLSAVQNIYSMVERDCETEIFPVCLEKGIGVVPFSPIASGFLSGKVTAQEQFGFLLDAFKYGVPPHAGLAYGLDRLVMLMAKQDSIRDVIAFPKIKDASCLMTEAPTPASEKQLEELSLAVKAQEETVEE